MHSWSLLMLMYQCGFTLPKPSPAVSRCYVNFVAFVDLYRDPFSSRWWHLLSCRGWIKQSSSVFRRTLSRGFSLWWRRLLGWCFHRRGLTTSPRSSVNCIGWRRKSGLTSSWLSSCTNVCMVQLRHTLQTNFASLRISKPDDVCALLRHHHSSSAALVGPPLAIEHSRSPAPVFGTLEQSATAHYVCTFTACLPQPPQDSFLSALFPITFSSPVWCPCSDNVISDTIIDYCIVLYTVLYYKEGNTTFHWLMINWLITGI